MIPIIILGTLNFPSSFSILAVSFIFVIIRKSDCNSFTSKKLSPYINKIRIQMDGYVKKDTLPNLKFICKARTIRIFNPRSIFFQRKILLWWIPDTKLPPHIKPSFLNLSLIFPFFVKIHIRNTLSRYDMRTVIISIIPQNNRIVPAERKLLLIPSSCIKYSEECPLENIWYPLTIAYEIAVSIVSHKIRILNSLWCPKNIFHYLKKQLVIFHFTHLLS